MLKEYELQQGTMNLFVGNISAIDISKNLVQHSQKIYIDIFHHFIIEFVEEKIVVLEYVKTENQLVGNLPKPLHAKRF